MVQSVDSPPDNGRVKLPKVDSAMNRRGPGLPKGGRGSRKDGENIRLGSDPAKDAKLISKAKKRFEYASSNESQNRTNGVDDLKFKAGDQWPASVAAQRTADGRPCLTVNSMKTFVHQVTNEERISRPSINISPVGDRSDPLAAKLLRGMIRHIETECRADIAYDTMFDSNVSIGWGYCRVLTEYESPESMNKSIVIKRIRNPFAVYMDPAAIEPDGSDAQYCFISEMIPRDEFKEKYPDADEMAWTQAGPGDTKQNMWFDEKQVRIAEYFEIAYEQRRVVLLSNGHQGWYDDLSDEVKEDIKSGKLEILADRESENPTVKWYKITATEVLDREEWPGRWIPIVREVGDEIDIEGVVKYSGLIRDAKEPQRILNYGFTMAMEAVALQPKSPFIGAEGQFEGHEDAWDTANTKSVPYLEYKPTALNGVAVAAPQRSPPAVPSQGWDQVMQMASQGLMRTTGIRFDGTKEERVVDESGRALRELRRSSDTGSLHYDDNHKLALKHVGDILVDLIPKVYDTKRIVTIMREDDKQEQVTIDVHAPQAYQERQDPKTGKVLKIFNPTVGRYGVAVTIGANYATKRIEAAESMMDFVRAVAPAYPQVAAAVADLIAKNMDWPDAEQFTARLAKLVPPNLLSGDVKDISPQAQALIGQLQQQVQQLTQQLRTAAFAVNEKQGDRALVHEATQSKFEAAMLKMMSDFEVKMAGIQQKADQAVQTHIGSQIQDLAKGVQQLMTTMNQPAPVGGRGVSAGGDGGAPQQ